MSQKTEREKRNLGTMVKREAISLRHSKKDASSSKKYGMRS